MANDNQMYMAIIEHIDGTISYINNLISQENFMAKFKTPLLAEVQLTRYQKYLSDLSKLRLIFEDLLNRGEFNQDIDENNYDRMVSYMELFTVTANT